eukprot:1625864-Rhodomonas_salina.1
MMIFRGRDARAKEDDGDNGSNNNNSSSSSSSSNNNNNDNDNDEFAGRKKRQQGGRAPQWAAPRACAAVAPACFPPVPDSASHSSIPQYRTAHSTVAYLGTGQRIAPAQHSTASGCTGQRTA